MTARPGEPGAGLGGRTRPWEQLLAVLLLVTVTSSFGGRARAHGPAPAPLSVLMADQDRPELLTTNIGLAVRVDSSYAYVGPGLWGDVTTPLVAVGDEGSLALIGVEQVYTSDDRGCTLTPLLGPEPSAVIGMTGGEAGVWVMQRTDEDTALWGWSSSEGFLELGALAAGRLDSIQAGGGRLYAAGARPALTLVRLEEEALLDGRFEPHAEGPTSPSASPLQRVSVRWIDPENAERLWLAVATDEGVSAWASEDGGVTLREWARGSRSVHGPVPLCGGYTALVDGALVADPENPPGCTLESLAGHQLTCLGRKGLLTYACEERRIKRMAVREGQLVLEDSFGLEQIQGPQPGCPVGDDARQRSQLDWQHFGWEAGLIEPDDGGEGSAGSDLGPDETPAEGCACRSTIPAAVPGLALAESALGRLGFRAYWMGR